MAYTPVLFFSPHSLSVSYLEKRQVNLYPIWDLYGPFWGNIDLFLKIVVPTLK